MGDEESKVREVIEAIALSPSSVGLTHAKILRDEIVRLRSRVVELVNERDAQKREREKSTGKYLNPEEVLFAYAVASRENSTPKLPEAQMAEVMEAIGKLRALRSAIS